MVALLSMILSAALGGCKDCPEDDGNPCTTEICEQGVTKVTGLPNGSLCHTTGKTGACKNNVCELKCGQKSDCLDGNPCTTDFCDLDVEPNSCGHVEEPSLDPENKPPEPADDENPCTYGTCQFGSPAYLPHDDGTVCNAKGECRNGACSYCEKDSDCGKNTLCATWECSPKLQCVSTFAQAFTPFVDPFPNDCRTLVCDGNGATMDAMKPTDVAPDDGNPCTEETCKGWTPHHDPLPARTPCMGGKLCDGNGNCVDCLDDAGCGAGKVCSPEGTCVACCANCSKKCKGDACGGDSECASGHCNDGVCCDIQCGECRTCNKPGFQGTCKNVVAYGEDPPDGCLHIQDEMCNGNGKCGKVGGEPCISSVECASGKCIGGLCTSL